jgi:hypothetical protein
MSGVGHGCMDRKKHLESLIVWAINRGYHVELANQGDNCICHISKLIEINSSCSLDKQVIYLLHECGHALIFDNGSVYNFDEKRNSKKNSVAKKVFTVIEEIEAWKRGRELANRLHIPIDDEDWEKSMVKALKKYINWASDYKGRG